jgi:hypothetical protein
MGSNLCIINQLKLINSLSVCRAWWRTISLVRKFAQFIILFYCRCTNFVLRTVKILKNLWPMHYQEPVIYVTKFMFYLTLPSSIKFVNTLIYRPDSWPWASHIECDLFKWDSLYPMSTPGRKTAKNEIHCTQCPHQDEKRFIVPDVHTRTKNYSLYPMSTPGRKKNDSLYPMSTPGRKTIHCTRCPHQDEKRFIVPDVHTRTKNDTLQQALNHWS